MPFNVRSLADAITASGRGAAARRGLDLARGRARHRQRAGELAFSWAAWPAGWHAVEPRGPTGIARPGNRAIVAQLLPVPWRIELAQPASVSANLADGGFQLQGSARITLATAGPQLDTTFTTTAALDRHGRIGELVVRDGEVDVRDLRVAGMRLERGSIRCRAVARRRPGRACSRSSSQAPARRGPDCSSRASPHRPIWTCASADGRLSVSPRAPATLQLTGPSWG